VEITTGPTDRHQLRETLVRMRPGWLLMGEVPDEETTESVISCARTICPGIRLAMLGPADDMQRCQRWMRRGCAVYLDGESGLQQVVTGLVAATEGNLHVFSRGLYLRTLQMQDPLAYPSLTARQQEVLNLLSQGMSNAEIGSALHVTEHTVEFHVRQLFAKFHARSRLEVVRRAADIGLVA
jgi:DNA-binding NarL/FixJ family response regulator